MAVHLSECRIKSYETILIKGSLPFSRILVEVYFHYLPELFNNLLQSN